MANLDLLPIRALTCDGTVVMRDDGLFLSLKKGLGEIPYVRGSDQIVPGLAGRIPRSRIGDRMALELEGLVRGIPDEADNDPSEPVAYYDLVLECRNLFDPTKEPWILSCLLPDGSTASINVRVVPPLLWEELIPGRLARLNVALESVDPTWDIAASGSTAEAADYTATWTGARRGVTSIAAFRNVDPADPIAGFEFAPGLDITLASDTYMRLAAYEFNRGGVGSITPPSGFTLMETGDTGSSATDHTAAGWARDAYEAANPPDPGSWGSGIAGPFTTSAHIVLAPDETAPIFVGSTISVEGTQVESSTVDRPSGVIAGDVMVLAVWLDEDGGSANASLAATGWTRIGSTEGHYYYFRVAT